MSSFCGCAGIGCATAPSNVTDCYQWFISTSNQPWTACTEYVDFDCCAKSAAQRAYCDGQGLNCTDLNYGQMGCTEIAFLCPEGEGGGGAGREREGEGDLARTGWDGEGRGEGGQKGGKGKVGRKMGKRGSKGEGAGEKLWRKSVGKEGKKK